MMPYDRFVLPPASAPSAAPEGTTERSFVSRAGLKLQAALEVFRINVTGRLCADLGANVGGFTDCLLRNGAARVYAVDTAYGILAWSLRKDPRVVVRDRTNALHLRLPEPVSLVTVDVGWTRQARILPVVATLLSAAPPGIAPDDPSRPSAHPADVLTLIKPHYESELARIQRGVLTPEQSIDVLWKTTDRIAACGWAIRGIMRSPIEGQKGNLEYLAWLQPAPPGN